MRQRADQLSNQWRGPTPRRAAPLVSLPGGVFSPPAAAPATSREERKRLDAEARRKSRAQQARKAEVERLEGRIAETEAAIRELEARMAAPGFYDDRSAAQKAADEHQSLMWKVGELMQRWEDLQTDPDLATTSDR